MDLTEEPEPVAPVEAVEGSLNDVDLIEKLAATIESTNTEDSSDQLLETEAVIEVSEEQVEKSSEETDEDEEKPKETIWSDEEQAWIPNPEYEKWYYDKEAEREGKESKYRPAVGGHGTGRERRVKRPQDDPMHPDNQSYKPKGELVESQYEPTTKLGKFGSILGKHLEKSSAKR